MILHHSLERTEVTNDNTVRGSYKVLRDLPEIE